MSDTRKVVYMSGVRIECKEGPMRFAYLPAETEPVVFGVHSEIAASGTREMGGADSNEAYRSGRRDGQAGAISGIG